MQPDDRSRNIRLILAGVFCLWFSLYTYPSFLSVYAEDLGASPAMIGLIVGSYGLVQMALRIPLGICSDWTRRRKPFVLAGLALAVVSALGFVFMKTPESALAFRGMAGSVAATWVALSVMYSSHFQATELPRAMGRVSIVQYASQLLAMLLGGAIARAFGRDAAFIMAALGALAGLVFVGFTKDRKPTGLPLRLADILEVICNRRLLLSSLFSLLFNFICWGTVLGFTANWANTVMEMDELKLGALSAMYLLPNTFIPGFTTGSWLRRLGERNLMMLGFGAVSLACALFGFTRSLVPLYAVQMLFGIGMSMIMPLNLTGAICEIRNEQRGIAMGIYQSLYAIGMFVGPFAAGRLIETFSAGGELTRGFIANFTMMAALAICGALLVAWLVPGKRKEKSVHETL